MLGAPWERVVGALWEHASRLPSSHLGWQEVATIEFGMRVLAADGARGLPDLARSRLESRGGGGSMPMPGGSMPMPGGSEPPGAVSLGEAADALVARLSHAATSAFAIVKKKRKALDVLAARAALSASPAPWASVAVGSPVLLMNAGSAGSVNRRLSAALRAAGLLVAHYHRFADARLPGECPPAAAWPHAPWASRDGQSARGDDGALPSSTATAAAVAAAAAARGYAAVVLRLPPSRSALDHATHAAASVLCTGGLLIILGCRDEGIHSTHACLPTRLFESVGAAQPLGGAAAVLCARRAACTAVRIGIADFDEHCMIMLPIVGQPTAASFVSSATDGSATPVHGSAAPAHGSATPVRWLTLPGLFASGLVDVMTSALLSAMPPPLARAKVLDFCAGSGVIAAALLAAEPTLRLHLLDADALAVRAARVNLGGGACVYLGDGWDGLPRGTRFGHVARGTRFDLIVSNPPVHLGLQTDFRILRTLIAGAAKRLRHGGALWLVAQTYVPVGRLLARQAGRLCGVRAAYDDGRFTVWTATKAARCPPRTDAQPEPAASAATARKGRKLEGDSMDAGDSANCNSNKRSKKR